MEATHESVLVEAAKAGDAGALERLLESQQARLFRFSMKMCRNEEDAKDIVQDTMLAMSRSIASFRGASSLSTWTFTIARNFCLKRRRHEAQFPVHEGAPIENTVASAPVAIAPSPETQVAVLETEQKLDEALAMLDPSLREVLILRDIEGLRAAEVAEVMEISVAAVKSRLHRARLELRERIAPLLQDAPQEGDCPDILENYSKQIENEIDPQLCARLEHHLTTCARCQASCAALKRTLALCRDAGERPVPPSVQAAIRDNVRKLLSKST